MPDPERVGFYIDGYNLYCGIRDTYGHKWLWLDLGAMCQKLIRSDQEIVAIHYCTTRTKGSQDKWRRQDDYWKALGTVPKLEIHEGFHQKNKKRCTRCRKVMSRHEEKQTDSRIASLMVADAMANRVDTLILIAGDSDHIPPVQIVKKEAPTKTLLVCWPPNRKSDSLGVEVGSDYYISRRHLKQNQFPQTVTLGDGSTVDRPATWV